MEKNKKTTVPPAPAKEEEVYTPEPIEPNKAPMRVLDMNEFINQCTGGIQANETTGLDPNRRVDLLRIMHETFRQDQNAATKYRISQETVDEINHITAIGQIAALENEIVFAKNPFAIVMNQAQIDAINKIGEKVGLTIATKALPAPDEEGKVQIPSSAIKVSDEAKKALKEEKKIREKVVEVDPTKVNNDEDLKNCLIKIMTETIQGYAKIADAITFMRSYLSLKAENDEAKKKIEELTNRDILVMIKNSVGACPFVLNGMGRAMFTVTSVSKSPISAFAMFRNATKNKTTGACAISDQEVADYVRVIVEWACETEIAKANENLSSHEDNLRILMKDKKKNAKGIDDITEKINKIKASIEHYNSALKFVIEPTAEVPEDLIDKYKKHDPVAERIFDSIIRTYYDDVTINEMEIADVYNNVEQYAGIIHNMFRDPMAQLDQYSLANIVQINPKPKVLNKVKKSAETPAEDKKKKDSSKK